jgi:hypothetical protein
VALPALSARPVALGLSSLVAGASVPGVVPLVLGRVRELAGSEAEAARGWSLATTGFAIGQALAAYGFSFLFAQGLGYGLVFALGSAALLLGLILDLAVRRSGGGA